MIYAMLGDVKHGPYTDLKELRSKLFYEGEKGDVMHIFEVETGNKVATWKKAWIRMDEGYAWHDIERVNSAKGGV